MIRVLIADDHGVVRDGLGRLISALADIEVVGLAADGAQALEQCRATHPDVVLMDLEMPGMDGIEATRAILVDAPGTAVLVLTSFSDRPRILGALEAGACGYLLKDVSADRGRGGHPRRGARRVAARPARREHDPGGAQRAGPGRRRCPRASGRCWACSSRGCPNKLIARRLEISEKTVKAHLTSVFRAIGVTDRTQAALWAERHGSRAPDGPDCDQGPIAAGATVPSPAAVTR